jgi:hypothetical protein
MTTNQLICHLEPFDGDAQVDFVSLALTKHYSIFPMSPQSRPADPDARRTSFRPKFANCWQVRRFVSGTTSTREKRLLEFCGEEGKY